MISRVILILGIITYSLLVLSLMGLILFRIKRKRPYYKMHRILGIITLILATSHALVALLYYFGLI